MPVVDIETQKFIANFDPNFFIGRPQRTAIEAKLCVLAIRSSYKGGMRDSEVTKLSEIYQKVVCRRCKMLPECYISGFRFLWDFLYDDKREDVVTALYCRDNYWKEK